jgi:hypothetical protein
MRGFARMPIASTVLDEVTAPKIVTPTIRQPSGCSVANFQRVNRIANLDFGSFGPAKPGLFWVTAVPLCSTRRSPVESPVKADVTAQHP